MANPLRPDGWTHVHAVSPEGWREVKVLAEDGTVHRYVETAEFDDDGLAVFEYVGSVPPG